MKVLVIHSELGVLRGGGENVTRNLFEAFSKRGHEVTAAFVAAQNGSYPIPLPSGIVQVPLSGWWSRKLGQAALSSIGRRIPPKSRLRAEWDRVQQGVCWRTIQWHDRRFSRRVEGEFARRWKQFDAVYIHSSAILAGQVARYRPTVLFLPGPVGAELEPVLRASHAVCAHDDALAQIRQFLGDHAMELKLGLNGDLFTPGPSAVRMALGWTRQDCVIGYVGRLAHIKGVDLLATAFREMSRDLKNVKLLLIGSGEEENKIRSVLSKEFGKGMVHIESDLPHERLAEWYRAMDLFVMPSRYETMSNALLEAQACGVPFLASDIAGNRIIAKAGGGWLFGANCADSLGKSLRDIMGNRHEMKSRGILGAEHVRRHYSWGASAERLERIFASRLGVTG
jgi:glycosyltransferase involved in cell wall biosynthesis